MARLVQPLMSLEASGSVGGALSYGNRLGKNVVRAYSKPKKLKSYAQGQQMDRYQAYVEEWKYLYPARKAVFSARAAAHGRVSGFHQFLSENLQPDMVGQTLLTPEMVGLWHFNTGSGGTAYDATQYHNDGTLQGPAWTPGKYGSGLYFDGVDNYVSGLPAIWDVGSISFWLLPDYPAGARKEYYIARIQGVIGSDFFTLQNWDNGFSYWGFLVGGVDYRIRTSVAFPPGWFYVRFEWSVVTGISTLFFNSVFVGSTSGLFSIYLNPQSLYFGRIGLSSDLFYSGRMDDVCFSLS